MEGDQVDLFKTEQYDPKYLKLNPKGVVPTLVHDGTPIIESTLICEYLDETFPDPPLMPKEPGRARADAAVEQVRRRGPVRRRHRVELLRHVPRAHAAAMTPELREKRFANVGDPRRRDRFKSTYEHGVQSPFVLHAIAAYERAFKLMEQTLAERGPWILGAKPDARRHQPDAVCRAARPISGCSKPGPPAGPHVDDWWARVQRMAELPARPARPHQRGRVRRNAHPRPENPRPTSRRMLAGAAARQRSADLTNCQCPLLPIGAAPDCRSGAIIPAMPPGRTGHHEIQGETPMDDITKRDPVKITRRGHQPALQLGPPSAGARHHGRRFRGARRLPPPAPLPARPRASRRWRSPTSARCCCSTTTTSATSPRPRSANGRATSSRAGRCCRAAATRSCGTSARPPCTTSSIRPGSSRRTARPAWSACAAPSIRRSA